MFEIIIVALCVGAPGRLSGNLGFAEFVLENWH